MGLEDLEAGLRGQQGGQPGRWGPVCGSGQPEHDQGAGLGSDSRGQQRGGEGGLECQGPGSRSRRSAADPGPLSRDLGQMEGNSLVSSVFLIGTMGIILELTSQDCCEDKI